MGSRHIFNIKLTPARVLEIIFDNFTLSTSWHQALKIKRIKFVIAETYLFLLFISTLIIEKVKFTISAGYPKLLQNLPITLAIKKIKIVPIWEELYELVQAMSIKRIKFSTLLRQILRIAIANITIKKIGITAIATVGIFYTLSHWDTYYLSDLDSYYLSEMDIA